MKKLILILAIAGFITQSQAQKLMTKDVPAAVTAAFSNAHPSVKDVEWRSKDGTNYQAEYDADKGDVYVTYDPSGTLIETEVEISNSAIPAFVIEYVKANYKEDEVRKASKITDASGVITYKAKVKGMYLLFDATGNYIKTIKNKV